jgi:signal peptidase I
VAAQSCQGFLTTDVSFKEHALVQHELPPRDERPDSESGSTADPVNPAAPDATGSVPASAIESVPAPVTGFSADPPPVLESHTFQPAATVPDDVAAAATLADSNPIVSDRPPVFDVVSGLPPPSQPPAPQEAIDRGFSISLSRIGEELLAWFKTLLSAAVYATLIVTFGFQVARVEGQSMVPTLEDQDRLIVNKLAYRLGEPRVGDIVMLYYPEDPSKSFVKRIVAEPGDTIKIVDGRVLRNDVPLADDFIPEKYRDHDNLGPFVLPRGYYYVMGDHRNNSSDSRTWGYVPKRYIIGKVQLRWWPVNSAKVF